MNKGEPNHTHTLPHQYWVMPLEIGPYTVGG